MMGFERGTDTRHNSTTDKSDLEKNANQISNLCDGK